MIIPRGLVPHGVESGGTLAAEPGNMSRPEFRIETSGQNRSPSNGYF